MLTLGGRGREITTVFDDCVINASYGIHPISPPISSVQYQLSGKQLPQPTGAPETATVYPLQHPKELERGNSKIWACYRRWKWGAGTWWVTLPSLTRPGRLENQIVTLAALPGTDIRSS
jgi:hypothetical protein